MTSAQLSSYMMYLADQLNKLKDVPNLKEMYCTISKFHEIMEEVVNFICNWLKS